jgi:hypothetical protein
MPMIDKVTVPEGERGLWRVERFQITKTDAAIAAFSYRARVPSPGTYTKLMHGRCLVMSDTPAEMRDHYAFVLAAKGHVLISGLGLGMVLGACLRRPDVETVTVLEIDADLIALVGPHYADSRVKIIRTDALLWNPPKGVRYGAVWHDIWTDICGDNKGDMKRLIKRYCRRAEWVGCWCKDETYGR